MPKHVERVQVQTFENLKANPFFFLRFEESFDTDDNGETYDTSEFVSIDPDLSIAIKAFDYGDRIRTYLLCLADIAESTIEPNDPNKVNLHFHSATLRNTNDFIQVLNMYLKHLNEQEHRYAYLELLWLLNDDSWTERDITNVLGRYNPNSIPTLCSVMSSVGRCLCIKKQNNLHNALNAYGFDHHVYNPTIIQDALSTLGDDLIYEQSDKNLYQAVDYILNKASSDLDNKKGNPLLELKRWLQSDNPLTDYQQLVNIYSLVNEPTRLNIVKRWFHDIRLGHTAFDPALLEQFKDNRFNEFIKYRYCIKTPGEPIVLTVPLLCDNILTLYNTGGKNFLSFDGVLDFAITHCDTAHPRIDFKMNRFIPECDGGAKKNDSFCGFIGYGLIYKLDESKLSEESIVSFLRLVLNKFGRKKTYYACSYGEDIALDEDQKQHCFSLRVTKKSEDQDQRTYKYDCCELRYYKDLWLVSNKADIDFSLFLREPIDLSEECEVDLKMLSAEKLSDYIRQIPSKFEVIENKGFLVYPYQRDDTLTSMILDYFCIIDRMRIYPNKSVLAGLDFDVFGIRKAILDSKNIDANGFKKMSQRERDEIKKEHEEQESAEVHKRVIKALSDNYQFEEYNEPGNYFETGYDAVLLNEIILKFYYQRAVAKNDLSLRSFLEKYTVPGFKPLCSPKLSEANNLALNFQFFWCQGKECFHNCLGNQTLSATDNWRDYTLFHLVEIIGYSKIHPSEAGNEADDVVRQLVGVSIKVIQKFKRLKCRGCGHMMFTSRRHETFNRHNFFACANPNCSEYNKEVYLNHCFKCKKGLIDSRDHKKCPNGWHICPTCLSCCDNRLFERLAQRYIVDNKAVPTKLQSLRGHGHDDLGMKYCPKCGTLIEGYTDGRGEQHFGCPICHDNYDQFM